MKKRIALVGVFFLLVGMCGFAGAYTITYDYTLEGDGNSYTTSVANAIVEDFSGGTLSTGWALSGNYALVQGSLSGKYAAPDGLTVPDTSFYLTVPKDYASAPTAVFDFGAGEYGYFGLWWGSVDSYNLLEFYNNGALVEAITGSQAVNPSTANGDQQAPDTNLYVNFFNLSAFDEVRLTSTSYAFELDNVAVAPVPEPSTMILLGSGLAGLAWFNRKRKKA